MKLSIRFTYDAFTEESIVAGCRDDGGFCDENGDLLTDSSYSQDQIDKIQIECFGTDEENAIEYLIEQAIALGCCHPSDSPGLARFYTSTSNVDIETGNSISYSVHIDTDCLELHKAIQSALFAYRLEGANLETIQKYDELFSSSSTDG